MGRDRWGSRVCVSALGFEDGIVWVESGAAFWQDKGCRIWTG